MRLSLETRRCPLLSYQPPLAPSLTPSLSLPLSSPPRLTFPRDLLGSDSALPVPSERAAVPAARRRVEGGKNIWEIVIPIELIKRVPADRAEHRGSEPSDLFQR